MSVSFDVIMLSAFILGKIKLNAFLISIKFITEEKGVNGDIKVRVREM